MGKSMKKTRRKPTRIVTPVMIYLSTKRLVAETVYVCVRERFIDHSNSTNSAPGQKAHETLKNLI